MEERVGFAPVASLSITPGRENAPQGRVFLFRPFESPATFLLYILLYIILSYNLFMEERVGFEPTDVVKHLWFSRPAPSTARTSLQLKDILNYSR